MEKFNGYEKYYFTFVNQFKKLVKIYIWMFILYFSLAIIALLNDLSTKNEFRIFGATLALPILILIFIRTKRYRETKELMFNGGKFIFNSIEFSPDDVQAIEHNLKLGMYGRRKNVHNYQIVFKTMRGYINRKKRIALANDEFPEVQEIINYLLAKNEALEIIEVTS